MERAFTPPLLARMGEGSWPDPNNITTPVMTAFNDASWQAATKQLSAHPMGGLRFSSFRSAVAFFLCPCGSFESACAYVRILSADSVSSTKIFEP